MKKILSIMLVLCFMAGVAYCSSEWDKDGVAGTLSPASIDDYNDVNMEALDRVLSNYQRNCSLVYASAATLTINIGEMVCSNSAGTIRRMRAITSAITLTWSNIDTGSETNDTYYVYAVADADATTFTGVISLNSSTPTGVTYFKRLGSFENTSGDITRASITNDDNTYALQFGDWESKSSGTSYQATTDGYVVGYTTGGNTITGYTDSSNPPTTIRIIDDTVAQEASITLPVKKGDYWKIVGTLVALYWIPTE